MANFYSVAEVVADIGLEANKELILAVDKMLEQYSEHVLLCPPSYDGWRKIWKGDYYYFEDLRRPIERFARLWLIGVPYWPDTARH